MSVRTLGNISIFITLIIASVSTILASAFLTAVEVVSRDGIYVEFGAPPTLHATSWVVFDPESGKILASNNPDATVSIASVTKLPAAKVLRNGFDLEATTTVTGTDVATEGRAGRLSAGEVYTVRTLLFPLLLESSNDAASVLMRTDTDLVSDMNLYADELGLSWTEFHDASGLSDQNVSTARELALIAHDVYLHDRYLLDITHLPSYLGEQNGWMNNSPFIDAEGYIGGKHGYTPLAKHTAVALFDERVDRLDTRPIGYVVLGSSDLAGDVSQLRAYVAGHVSIR